MRIKVKDSEWYREAFDMPNIVHVYVGETRAEHKARAMKERNAKFDKDEYNRYYGFSGYDEFNEREEVDLA